MIDRKQVKQLRETVATILSKENGMHHLANGFVEMMKSCTHVQIKDEEQFVEWLAIFFDAINTNNNLKLEEFYDHLPGDEEKFKFDIMDFE